MSLNLIIMFSLTVMLASIIPGPSMLLALTHGIRYGAKRTVASAMGNVTVTFIQASISVAGLGTILLASETAFEVVKWLGAGYLVYMGVNMLLSSKVPLKKASDNDTSEERESLKRMYLQAAFVTAGNPKAIVFFGAVFPQFINPDALYVPQFLTLVSICVLTAFFSFMIYAIGGQQLSSLFSSTTIGTYIKRVIGGAFIGSGVALAFSGK